MLTLERNWLNIKCMHYLSRLGILPMEVEVKTGKIKIREAGKLNYILVLSILYQLYVIQRLASFLWSWRHYGEEALPLAVLSFAIKFGAQFGLFAGVQNFVINPGLTTTVFNNSLDPYTPVTYSKARKRKTPKKARNSYTLTDRITFWLPVFVASACMFAAIGVVFLQSSRLVQGRISLLSACAVVVADTSTFTFWLLFLYFGMHLQMMFLGKVAFILQQEITYSRY